MSPALTTCETRQVLLAGVSGGFPGYSPFAQTYPLARLDMSEIILKGTLNWIKKKNIIWTNVSQGIIRGFGPKINEGYYDLYFIVHWYYLFVSWWLCSVCTICRSFLACISWFSEICLHMFVKGCDFRVQLLRWPTFHALLTLLIFYILSSIKVCIFAPV